MDKNNKTNQKMNYAEARRRRNQQRKRRRRRQLTLILILVLLMLIALAILIGRKVSNKNHSGDTGVTEGNFTVEDGIYKDSLENLLERLENIDRSVVSEESLAVLDQKIEEAKKVQENNGSQQELDHAYAELTSAMQDLEYIGE